jgi:putative transposase
MVETFFKTLKSELVWRTTFHTHAEAEQAITSYIDGCYNTVRRHSALDFLSPAQFEPKAVNGANASPLYRDRVTP